MMTTNMLYLELATTFIVPVEHHVLSYIGFNMIILIILLEWLSFRKISICCLG